MRLSDELQLMMRDPDLYTLPDLAHAVVESGDISDYDAGELLATLIQVVRVQHRAILRVALEIDRRDEAPR